MYERELKCHAFMFDYLRRLAADLPDDRLADQPHPGMNHPAWILGHLAIAYDYVGQCVGLPLQLKRWHPLFSPGTSPVPERGKYPSKAELLEKLEANAARVLPAVPNADPTRLAGPQPVEILKPHIMTVGELLTHLLTSHIGTHVGQLSVWRRVIGMPGVLNNP